MNLHLIKDKLKDKYHLIFLYALISFVLLSWLQLGSYGTDEYTDKYTDTKKILFISSYSPSFDTFNDQIQGIKDGLIWSNTILKVEYMDTKQFNTAENKALFYDSLKYKLEIKNDYDVVIVADDNALSFAFDYQDELFKNMPIVFFGINNIDNAISASNNPYITGVIEATSIKETIEIALKLNSEATRVVALSDNTTTGQSVLEAFYQLESDFKEVSFTDIDLSTMDFSTYKKELKKLGERDIVLLLAALQDKNGSSISFSESVELVSTNVSQPVYHIYYYGIGDGLLGGKVISQYDQGLAAANIVNQIFNGKEISTIPFTNESPNEYYFDYSLIQKYKLDESLLPKDTILINKEPSFLQAYFKYILIAIFIMLSEACFIMFLSLNIKRRKQVEVELKQNKENLLLVNSQLVTTNHELTAAIEEIEHQDKKIDELIYLDPLSGMNNRYAITQKLDDMINKNALNRRIYLLFMDIDNFKNINDTHGHDIGDFIIQQFPIRLKKLINERVSIGRFGGDEFVITVEGDEGYSIQKFIESIEIQLIEPFKVKGIKFHITVSIGVASYPIDCHSRAELIKKADIALYKAKELGKNQTVIFTETLNEAFQEKLLFQEAIKSALTNEEFYLNYQPYVSLNENRVIGVEALIRWNSKELGYVSPYKFITIAEEMGIITEISHWVLRESCLFAKRINDKLDIPIVVSVNISGYQLAEEDFYSSTIKIIDDTEVDPSLITLEMTETVLIESIENGKDAILKLQEKGIKIAIDDFGAGYSSLRYFNDLPASIIKIDKSFIDKIEDIGYEYNLVKTMTELAHQKEMLVVAEGLERLEQLEAIKQLGTDIIQGYYFSKPVEEAEVIRYIDETNKKL